MEEFAIDLRGSAVAVVERTRLSFRERVAAYLARQDSPGYPQPLNPMVSITVAHVACGALVLATTILITLRALRILKGRQQFEVSNFKSEIRDKLIAEG